MPIRKIEDFKKECQSPEHNPPRYQVFEPGEYEYECPVCGKRQIFIVPLIT